MATKQPFLETPIDHTPYSAFALVILIAGVVFVVGALGLIKAGSHLQHFLAERNLADTNMSVPSLDPFSGAQNELNSLEQTAKNSAVQAAQAQASAAASSAASQLQNAAQASVENQVDNLKNGVGK